ncbi:hypothetical protein EDB19DRAFT_1902902 [Suillus lakei]|nr:hypothetical protein EDB19DRAFT_1902902 [Suillus lakei]
MATIPLAKSTNIFEVVDMPTEEADDEDNAVFYKSPGEEEFFDCPAEAQFTEYVESPVIRTSDQSLQSSPTKPAQTRRFPALSEPRTRRTSPEMHRTRSHTFGNPSVLCPVRSV